MARSLKSAHKAKKDNAKRVGIPFDLTQADYQQLLNEAGITYEDVGKGKYNLSRYNDKGGYTMGNCRFLWCKENLDEIDWTPERCQARSELRKKDWAAGRYDNRVIDVSKRDRDTKGKFI